MYFPQSPQTVETLLSFLADGTSVKSPGVILHQMNTKEFALDNLYGGAIDVQWGVVPWCFFPSQSLSL